MIGSVHGGGERAGDVHGRKPNWTSAPDSRDPVRLTGASQPPPGHAGGGSGGICTISPQAHADSSTPGLYPRPCDFLVAGRSYAAHGRSRRWAPHRGDRGRSVDRGRDRHPAAQRGLRGRDRRRRAGWRRAVRAVPARSRRARPHAAGPRRDRGVQADPARAPASRCSCSPRATARPTCWSGWPSAPTTT